MGKANNKGRKILSVIAYYDNGPEVLEFIKRSTSAADSVTVDYVIVINKDSDGSSSQHLTDAKYYAAGSIIEIVPGENVGYLNALLFALRKVNVDEYLFLVLSNTDIDFCTPVFYDKLLEAHYADKIGCIAPSVVSRDGKTYSNPHYLERIPLRKMKRAQKALSNTVLSKPYFLLSKIKSLFAKSSKAESCFVYSPHGCFMIFTPDFARLLQGEIYPPIMYSEESFIGEMLRLHNMNCYYDANIEVVHDESTITGKLPTGEKAGYMGRSLKYIISRFYSNGTKKEFIDAAERLRSIEAIAQYSVVRL